MITLTTPYRCVDCGRVGTTRFVLADATDVDSADLRCANRRACEYRQIRHPRATTT